MKAGRDVISALIMAFLCEADNRQRMADADRTAARGPIFDEPHAGSQFAGEGTCQGGGRKRIARAR